MLSSFENLSTRFDFLDASGEDTVRYRCAKPDAHGKSVDYKKDSSAEKILCKVFPGTAVCLKKINYLNFYCLKIFILKTVFTSDQLVNCKIDRRFTIEYRARPFFIEVCSTWKLSATALVIG